MRDWLWGLLLALGISFIAQAKNGNEVGNGGNAVVCRNGRNVIETVRLLDYYEAALLLDVKADLGDADQPMDKVRFVLGRLTRYDEKRAKKYLEKAEEFFDNARFIDSVILPDTKDYGYVPLEKGCEIEQLAIQRKPIVPEAKRYVISRDLWKRLSHDHQAGLILHEIVYGDALEKGHKDSVLARYLTALVSSAKFLTLAQVDYDKRISDIGMGDTVTPGVPHWVADPVVLAGALEGKAYSASLDPYVKNIDDGLLTFSKIQGPAWASVSSHGKINGTPTKADVGTNAFTIRVTNSSGFHSNGNVVIRVDHTAQPLTVKWKVNPIDLGVQREGWLWSFDLKTLVDNPWQDTLYFTAAGLPGWMRLNGVTGILSGTPSRPDVGSYSARLSVSNGEFGDMNARAFGEVRKAIQPAKWAADTIVLPDAMEDRTYTHHLAAHVLNPDAADLKFELISGVSWLKLSSSGSLYGTPTKSDVGPVQVAARVTAIVDGLTFADTATLKLTVLHQNHPPVWLADPIHLEACVNQHFKMPLLGQFAADFDGDVLGFAMKWPSWLSVVMPDGSVTGTPSEVGDYSFPVEVSDGQASARATVIIRVKPCR